MWTEAMCAPSEAWHCCLGAFGSRGRVASWRCTCTDLRRQAPMKVRGDNTSAGFRSCGRSLFYGRPLVCARSRRSGARIACGDGGRSDVGLGRVGDGGGRCVLARERRSASSGAGVRRGSAGASAELSALRWRVNTQVLMGTSPPLGLDGSVVNEGLRLVSKMSAELVQLHTLQPGADTARLKADVDQVYANGFQQLASFRKLAGG